MVSINAVRVPVSGSRARGADASVMYGLPEEQRNYVLTLLNRGMTLEESLTTMANQLALPIERVTESGEHANPFSSP